MAPLSIGIWLVARGDDLDRAVAVDRSAQVAQFGAVQLDADRLLAEPGPIVSTICLPVTAWANSRTLP